MKKGIYLTILTLITVICIIAGSIYHLTPVFEDGWSSISRIFTHNDHEDAGSVKTSDTISLDEFSGIIVDTSVASITICNGENYSIAYQANQKLIPTYEVKDNVLTVSQKTKMHNLIGNKNCEITITIPEQTLLNSIHIDCGVGDFTINGIKATSLNIDGSVGDQHIEDCSIPEIETDSSVGDIDITNSSFSALEVDSSVGDVSVTGNYDLSDYEMDLDTSVGEVRVNQTNHKHNYSQNGDAGSITIDNSTGNITIKY